MDTKELFSYRPADMSSSASIEEADNKIGSRLADLAEKKAKLQAAQKQLKMGGGAEEFDACIAEIAGIDKDVAQLEELRADLVPVLADARKSERKAAVAKLGREAAELTAQDADFALNVYPQLVRQIVAGLERQKQALGARIAYENGRSALARAGETLEGLPAIDVPYGVVGKIALHKLVNLPATFPMDADDMSPRPGYRGSHVQEDRPGVKYETSGFHQAEERKPKVIPAPRPLTDEELAEKYPNGRSPYRFPGSAA